MVTPSKMTTAFISGLCLSLSPVHCRILNASSNIKKTATSIRRATAELPADLSIMFAKPVVEDACNALYARIFEIAILCFIRINRIDFSIKRVKVKNGLRVIRYHPHPNLNKYIKDLMFLMDEIPDGWLADAVEELVMGPVWDVVIPYIDDVDVVKTVLRQRIVLMDTWYLLLILNFIAPVSIVKLLLLRDDETPYLETGYEPLLHGPRCSDFRLEKYLKQFNFKIHFDANERWLESELYSEYSWAF